MTTMQTIRQNLKPEDVMVRCGNHVLVAQFNIDEGGAYYCPQIWAPLRRGDNFDRPFEEQHLEDVTPWDNPDTLHKFKTEGQALYCAAHYTVPDVFS